MSAAGYANGFEAPVHLVNGGGYQNVHKNIEVLNGFERELGITYTPNTIDYNTTFQQSYRDSEGDFEGITWKAGPSPVSSDPVARFAWDYYSKGGRTWYGHDSAGKGDKSGDPFVDQEIFKAQREVDEKKRLVIIQSLQRHLAKTQYALRWPGGATNFSLAWPALQNFNVWRPDDHNRGNLRWWVDGTKAPLNRA
jgi:ABC-type transport system substrate-binding protein